MPSNPFAGRNRGSGEAAPPQGEGVITPQEDGNVKPPDPNGGGGETPQEVSQTPPDGGDKGEQGDGTGEVKPPDAPPSEEKGGDKSPPQNPPSGEKKRIKNAALKGKEINIGTGDIVAVDGDGIFEVDAAQAARLLTIPGYEEA